MLTHNLALNLHRIQHAEVQYQSHANIQHNNVHYRSTHAGIRKKSLQTLACKVSDNNRTTMHTISTQTLHPEFRNNVLRILHTENRQTCLQKYGGLRPKYQRKSMEILSKYPSKSPCGTTAEVGRNECRVIRTRIQPKFLRNVAYMQNFGWNISGIMCTCRI